jgi:hypothetical protein
MRTNYVDLWRRAHARRGYGALMFGAGCMALLLMARPTSLPAQDLRSLADVARAEEARRKAVKTPAKVYTNDDLKPGDERGAVAPPAAPAAEAATNKPAAATTKPETEKPAPPAAKEEEPRKDEKYWKGRMAALREGIARNKILTDALQSRVNALNTDFANVDDPGQRAVIEENRKTALVEMDRVNRDTDRLNKAMFDLAEEARKASVPPGWLR